MSRVCEELHKSLRKLPRYTFPFDDKLIPKNGIYILFEKGELGHGVERIVRIGTHRGENNLAKRLKEHFINENKDRSIFRKNVGRALLNSRNDSYIDVWEIDFKVRKNRQLYGTLFDETKQLGLENEVSKYIQGNFTFAVIEVIDRKERLYFESKLISTVSLCDECAASDTWLGKFSPKEKIVASSMWLVNELYKEPFTWEEFESFKKKYIDV